MPVYGCCGAFKASWKVTGRSVKREKEQCTYVQAEATESVDSPRLLRQQQNGSSPRRDHSIHWTRLTCGRLSLSRRDSPEGVYLHSPPMFGHVPALLPYLQPPVVIFRRKEWAENEERVDYLACKSPRRRQRRSACLRFRRLPRLCCACPPRWFWPRFTGSRGFGGHFLLETDFKKK